MPKVYIDEFVGITNRLETLPLAFAIQKAYGHKIILDWRELDSFSVDDTKRGKVTVFSKIGGERVRDCDRAIFDGLAKKKVILRSLDGPSELLDPIYMEIPPKIHLKKHLTDEIKKTFALAGGRPVVGVHIRHGDFRLVDQDSYSINGEDWPAVPVWWYEKIMAKIVEKNKDACFFLSCTGDPASHEALIKNFDTISLSVASPYGYKNKTHAHRSAVNPVADLFALACCPMMLATPISGYSHWATNVLGIPATCLLPIPGATPDDPRAGIISMYGCRLPRWRAAGRTGNEIKLLDDNLSGVFPEAPADTSWL